MARDETSGSTTWRSTTTASELGAPEHPSWGPAPSRSARRPALLVLAAGSSTPRSLRLVGTLPFAGPRRRRPRSRRGCTSSSARHPRGRRSVVPHRRHVRATTTAGRRGRRCPCRPTMRLGFAFIGRPAQHSSAAGSRAPARSTRSRRPVSPTRGLVTVSPVEAGGRRAPAAPGHRRRWRASDRGVAVVVNLTAVGSNTSSYVTAWPTGLERPRTSNVNFRAGRVVANQAIVPVGAGGRDHVVVDSGVTHLVVDVQGWFGDGTDVPGSRLNTLRPARLADSRIGNGLPTGRVTAGTTAEPPGDRPRRCAVLRVSPPSSSTSRRSARRRTAT